MGLTWDVDLHFDDLRANMREAMPEAIHKALEHVAEVSGQQVPIEEGTLLGSQKVILDEDDSGYISYKTPYAHRQHEELSWHHEHGNAKYLELPMASEAEKALTIAGNEIDDRLSR